MPSTAARPSTALLDLLLLASPLQDVGPRPSIRVCRRPAVPANILIVYNPVRFRTPGKLAALLEKYSGSASPPGSKQNQYEARGKTERNQDEAPGKL